MEYGTLERQIHVAAPPAVVYEVVSRPEHIAQWWGTDETQMPAAPGAEGVLVWADKESTRRNEVRLTVVEAVPGERFCFRWNYSEGESPSRQNSMLVTFQLSPDGGGTLLRVTEEGMREQGWEAAKLEEYYTSHEDGWNTCLANLAAYVDTFATR